MTSNLTRNCRISEKYESIVLSGKMADFDIDIDIARSLSRMRTVWVNDVEDDFVFLVGDKRYDCPRIIPELLCPTTSVQHSVDPSITQYIVETNQVNEDFELFQSLCAGSAIRVTDANRAFFLSLSREFGNSCIPLSILRHFHTSYPVGQIYDHFGDCSLPFLASQFCELTWSELDNIPASALYHILSQTMLKLTSEDSLYFYLSSHFSSDPEYLDLLQFIRFDYLSAESISCFLSVLPDSIDHRLWESISRRLISRLDNESEFRFGEAKSLDGIIAYLTRKHGGNVHDKGIVTITSKSLDHDRTYAVRNAADLTSDTWFMSQNDPGQWVMWDFHDMCVRPTHYTISSYGLKSWVIESSLDGKKWAEIDRQTNTEYGKDHSWVASFAVSNSAGFRLVRLSQTGPHHFGSQHLGFRAFEVFGTLLE
jgi:hypothetical protein